MAKEHDAFCKSYLEEREAPVVLEQDAAGTPDITGLCPAQLCRENKASPVLAAAPTTPPSSRPCHPALLTENHFRGAVVPGGHDRGVVLVVEGGASKISHADARVPDGFLLAALRAKEKASELLAAGSGSDGSPLSPEAPHPRC